MVTPVRVDGEGHEYADDLHFRPHRRQRRSAVADLPLDPTDVNANWIDVHYSLKAFGQDFQLHLTPNNDFISPSLRVQHMDVNHTWLADPAYDSHCYHTATVSGDQRSAGAFSLCHHLVSSTEPLNIILKNALLSLNKVP